MANDAVEMVVKLFSKSAPKAAAKKPDELSALAKSVDNIKDMAIDASVSNGFTLNEALELLSNLCWQYRGSARNAMKRRIKNFLKDPKEVVKFNSELQKEYKTFK